MISVIGLAGVMAVVLSTLAYMSISDLREASHQRLYEQSLHVVDSGIDDTLFKVRFNPTYSTGETMPASFASDAAEKAWALGIAETVPGTRLVKVREGEWVAIKPLQSGGTTGKIIYSVGYTPSRAAYLAGDQRAKARVVRAEYDFAPFIPAAGILTGGSLNISGNPVLSGTGGSVHSNSNLTVSGNPIAAGYLATSSTYSVSGSPTVGDVPSTGGGKPTVEVALIKPRDMYHFSEYDLCPDGRVRGGPANSTVSVRPPAGTTTPCQGGELDDTSDGSQYRGWKKTGTDSSQGAKWDYAGDTAYDGVYYFYQGSAKVGSNPGIPSNPWDVTIIAESTQGTTPGCPANGGDIEISGNPVVKYNDKATPMALVAGRDLKLNGNAVAGTVNFQGIMAAYEQWDVSGNPVIHGAFVSTSLCDTPSSLIHANSISGNPSITYNSNLEMPIGNTVRTTLWLEL